MKRKKNKKAYVRNLFWPISMLTESPKERAADSWLLECSSSNQDLVGCGKETAKSIYTFLKKKQKKNEPMYSFIQWNSSLFLTFLFDLPD